MKFKNVVIVFSLVLAVECFANIYGLYRLQFFSKPALMLILINYFVSKMKPFPRLRYFLAAALAFSWIGDVFLLVEKQNRSLFVYGLISFLAAHICYVLYFWLVGDINREAHRLNGKFTFGIIFYSILFYIAVFPFLGEMKVPVLIYSVVISLMLISSFHAFDSQESEFAKMCLSGTLLFVLSDSILAVNRFVFPLPLGSVFVMITYALGQLLITEGSIRNMSKLSDC
ncbi:MAG: lysoplasmalogenase [Acidobacteria bacterium]|nr:lysoplasmalogenase [Acidobacteriota bacterium]